MLAAATADGEGIARGAAGLAAGADAGALGGVVDVATSEGALMTVGGVKGVTVGCAGVRTAVSADGPLDVGLATTAGGGWGVGIGVGVEAARP